MKQMKKRMLLSLMAIFAVVQGQAQSTEEKHIKETIMAFSKAGDQSDAVKLASFLDDNYQLVMNQLFGSSKVSIMPKDVYLEKIRSKEFGGDQRKVEIESMLLNGTNASAKVRFIGSKMTFISIITLIKNPDGNWKLIGEIPVVL
ncbi:MAG: nuclear transport factor 2 family protein [Candidatus Cyclobacteriaceae bacterium M3_2C_046]